MAKQKTEQTPLHEQEIMTKELAAIIGKTERSVNNFKSDKIIEQVRRGKYILGPTIQALIEHAAGGKEESNKPRLIDYRTESEKLKAEKSRLELAKMKGELHEAKDVATLLDDLILTTKSRLLAIPARIATELENESADTIEAVVRREIHTALTSLAKYNPAQIGAGSDEDG